MLQICNAFQADMSAAFWYPVSRLLNSHGLVKQRMESELVEARRDAKFAHVRCERPSSLNIILGFSGSNGLQTQSIILHALKCALAHTATHTQGQIVCLSLAASERIQSPRFIDELSTGASLPLPHGQYTRFFQWVLCTVVSGSYYENLNPFRLKNRRCRACQLP